MDLRTEQVTVDFEERRALAGITLHFSMGARALVLGNAESGKTVLLKTLAGLIRASSGRVLWNGTDVAQLSAEERRVAQAHFGMVFQTDALFDSLTVLDNVLLPLKRRSVPDAEARERAEEALRAVGLIDAQDSYPERLSGGMKKRAGIARAIVARPEVLFVDDPLAGLDPITGAKVSELLLSVGAGRSLIIAAPEPPQGLDIPRWLWLRKGQVSYDGPPDVVILEQGALEEVDEGWQPPVGASA